MPDSGPRKICVVTGSRADYGLLSELMALIRDDSDLCLQVAATGMHLAPEFGATVGAIEADGFIIDARVDMLLSGDSAAAVAKSTGLGVIGFADTLARLAPDFLLVLGDRFEIFAAVQAALIHRIPVAHLCGGDVTEGAFDDAIRHAITKMAHLHFVTNAAAAGRVRQMGEDAARIFNVGSPGLDIIKHFQPLPRGAFFAEIGLAPAERLLLVAFHPATLEEVAATTQIDELLEALSRQPAESSILLTGPNADTEGRALSRALAAFAADREKTAFHLSLGQRLFHNALHHAAVIVGNSSSGLYEAPSFATPTVNIGTRQKGRLQAESVVTCDAQADAIARALEAALSLDCGDTANPYGDGESAPRIVAALKAVENPRALVVKGFNEIDPRDARP